MGRRPRGQPPAPLERRAAKDDYVFEGHELEDVIEQANGILDDDVRVSEDDGRPEHIRPFTRKELLGPLERWFFGVDTTAKQARMSLERVR